jgi:hypothetical protein
MSLSDAQIQPTAEAPTPYLKKKRMWNNLLISWFYNQKFKIPNEASVGQSWRAHGLGVHGLDKSGLKTQPDRTHTHGLGRNFCPKPNPTTTLIVTSFYIEELLKSDTFEFNYLIAYKKTREKIENTKNTHNDIIDKNYEKWTQDNNNEMKKNVFNLNSITKLLNQISKSKANLIKVAKQRYANKIKKFNTFRKRLMKINSDNEDI